MKDSYVRARWVVIGLFGLLCLVTLSYNGPFFDEGIYVTAGLRTLEGHGLSDRFLTWFAGSLAWPVLGALGYQLGGLVGARALAVLLGVISLSALGRAATNLFNTRVGFWTTVAFAINGPFIALSRLAVYDVLALVWIAISFWAVTELVRQDHRVWLVIAAIAYPLAFFAKYPIGLMAAPLLGVLLLLRKQKAYADVLIFGFLAGAMGLAFFLPLREQIGVFFSWRLENRPQFGATLGVIAIALAYMSAAPAFLALIGWYLAKGRRTLASLLMACLAIWPVYHILAEDPVGTGKHVVFGFLFVYPLVGLTLSRLWSGRRVRGLRRIVTVFLILGLTGLGILQANQADRGWPNLRPPASFLVERVQPGETLLINESWPFTMYLYASDRIESPWDIYDTYRVTHEETAPSLCTYDWIVDVRGSYTWPAEIADVLSQCDGYRLVYGHTSTVTNWGSELRFISYPVETAVWQKVAEE